MKEDHVEKQRLLRTEQGAYYPKDMSRIQAMLLDAIRSGDPKRIQEISQLLLEGQLGESVRGNIEITKLYVAAFFSELIHNGKRIGIPRIHDLKMQPITPGKIAQLISVERTYLSKRFHEETGQTMQDYIHSIKIEMAETLIAERNYTLTEIADLLGYSSYTQFSRVYRKYRDSAKV